MLTPVLGCAAVECRSCWLLEEARGCGAGALKEMSTQQIKETNKRRGRANTNLLPFGVCTSTRGHSCAPAAAEKCLRHQGLTAAGYIAFLHPRN